MNTKRVITTEKEGSFETKRSRQDVFSFLVDPTQFIGLIPDVVESKLFEDGRFSIVWKVGIGMLKTTSIMEMVLAEEKENEYLVYSGDGKIKGAGKIKDKEFILRAQYTLCDSEDGTTVKWGGKMEIYDISPALKKVLEPLALLNIRRLISRVQKALENNVKGKE